MSEQRVKSNAPWILGIVGFGLSIPQVICSILCASAAASVAAEGGATASDAAAAGVWFMMPVICTVACFVLSFFGKSKVSTITGVILVVLGIIDAYACVVNWSVLGIAAAICFACAGISSICNAKKVA